MINVETKANIVKVFIMKNIRKLNINNTILLILKIVRIYAKNVTLIIGIVCVLLNMEKLRMNH